MLRSVSQCVSSVVRSCDALERNTGRFSANAGARSCSDLGARSQKHGRTILTYQQRARHVDTQSHADTLQRMSTEAQHDITKTIVLGRR